jgi:hypothetical protein
MLSQMMGRWTLTLEAASTVAFASLNVVYFLMIYWSRGRPVPETSLN